MFTELLEGVYSVDHRFVDGKNGIVIGQKGAVAIDAAHYPDEGQAMAEFIREQGWPPDRLILTHGHGDHILGGAVFQDAEIFAHAKTPGVIQAQLPAWAEKNQVTLEQAAAEVIWPTVTFQERLELNLGDRRLQLFPAPGHSPDGICVFLPEERVLFAGDTVSTGIAPTISNGDSRQLETSLNQLRRMTIEILVPGHGPVLVGQDRIQGWLGWLVEYLSSVQEAVQAALKRGDPAEVILTALNYETYIGHRLPKDRHGMPKRHRLVVQKIIDETIGSISGGTL